MVNLCSHRQALKLDIGSEPAVGDALNIKMVPSLLFINGGKLVYRLYGNYIQIFIAPVHFVVLELGRCLMTNLSAVKVFSLYVHLNHLPEYNWFIDYRVLLPSKLNRFKSRPTEWRRK